MWARIFIIFSLLLASPASGQKFKYPEDPDQVDFYLLTVDRGELVWARFGHNSIRVIDRKNGYDYNFNWGMFRFDEPNFVAKFYMGKLNFYMAIQAYGPMIRHYRDYEKRGIVQQKFNLTAEQKKIFFDRIVWNLKPENIFYQYSYFFNNCSTRIRDYIDEMLKGGIRKTIGAEKAEHKFRWHINQTANGVWWADLGLDFLSNSRLDQEVTKWDEMFLPENFRRYAEKLPQFDNEGNPIPGTRLLDPPVSLLDLPPPSEGMNPYLLVALWFGLPILGLISVAVAKPALLTGIGSRIAGAVVGIYGFWGMIWGLVMTLNWMFSGHVELHHNINLLILSPLHLVICFVGARIVFKGVKGGRFRKSQSILALHVFGALIGLLLYGMGVVGQDLIFPAVCYGTLNLLVFVLLYYLAKTSGETVVDV